MASLLPAGSRGAILAILLFQLMNTGWCQYGYLSGLCSDCRHLKTDLSEKEMNHYAHTNTKIVVCYPASIIKFQLGNNIVCGNSGKVWVNKLRKCIETKDFGSCKIVTTKSPAAASTSAFVLTTTKVTELTTHPTSTPKNPNFTKKEEHKITLKPNNDTTIETKNNPLAAFVLTTTTGTEVATCPAQVTTTSAVYAPAPAFVPTTGTKLTSHSTSTSKNPRFTRKAVHKIILEPNIDATNENKNAALAGAGLKDELKNANPAPQTDKTKHLMVAMLSLLAVVVSLIFYLRCRRKDSLFKRKASETSRYEAYQNEYDEVKQNEN